MQTRGSEGELTVGQWRIQPHLADCAAHRLPLRQVSERTNRPWCDGDRRWECGRKRTCPYHLDCCPNESCALRPPRPRGWALKRESPSTLTPGFKPDLGTRQIKSAPSETGGRLNVGTVCDDSWHSSMCALCAHAASHPAFHGNCIVCDELFTGGVFIGTDSTNMCSPCVDAISFLIQPPPAPDGHYPPLHWYPGESLSLLAQLLIPLL